MRDLRRALRAGIRNLLTLCLPLAYRMFHRGRSTDDAADVRQPKRILVLNGAHIGDIVISTSILPILRSAYPAAKIGFVVGSWSKMVLDKHPDVDFVHCIDHWFNNRNRRSILSKVLQYRRTRQSALREIREQHYEMALCLCPFPIADLMEVAWEAGIPVRLGFRPSLYSSLATGLSDVPTNPFLTQGAVQAAVLSPLHLDVSHLQKRRATLPESSEDATREVCKLLGISQISHLQYRVIHMGSGVMNRELPPRFWREVAEELSKWTTLIFTGKGERESDNVDCVISGLDHCINACDQLSWDGFVAAIRFAEVVYGVESMAGHVAAAVGTTGVAAYTGVSGVAKWRPDSPGSSVFSRHVACAPCHDVRGCEAMTCRCGVSPKEFLNTSHDMSLITIRTLRKSS